MIIANARPFLVRARSLLDSRTAWSLLVVIAIGALAVGSIHPSSPSAAQRRSYLDSIIKCPSCADASLAQSETGPALELKATIASWVASGLSNSEIEQRVVAEYGPGEILRPTNPVVWVLPLVAFALAAIVLVTVIARRRTLPPINSADLSADEAVVARARKDKSGS